MLPLNEQFLDEQLLDGPLGVEPHDELLSVKPHDEPLLDDEPPLNDEQPPCAQAHDGPPIGALLSAIEPHDAPLCDLPIPHALHEQPLNVQQWVSPLPYAPNRYDAPQHGALPCVPLYAPPLAPYEPVNGLPQHDG